VTYFDGTALLVQWCGFCSVVVGRVCGLMRLVHNQFAASVTYDWHFSRFCQYQAAVLQLRLLPCLLPTVNWAAAAEDKTTLVLLPCPWFYLQLRILVKENPERMENRPNEKSGFDAEREKEGARGRQRESRVR
jgi:hypothetical protein